VGGAVVLTALLSLAALHLGRAYAVEYPEIHPAYWRIVFILAVAGLLIAAFERPPRWPTTVPHVLNSVYFVVLPLVLFRLKTVYYDPGNSPSALLESTLLGGTIAYAIAALGCGIAVRRGARDALTVTGLVMTALMTPGAALIAISEFRTPSSLSVPGCGILLAAAVSSLVTAAILLRRLLRPRVSAGR
jgi:hypothetical protein